MHAYLITGSTPQKRLEEARKLLQKNKAEQAAFLQTKTRHPISAIRELNRSLSLKTKGTRGIMIENAHFLTLEAANSFLKTLEEPAGDTIIILTAPNRELVLETISSRTQVIDLGPAVYKPDKEEKEKAEETLKELLGSGIGQRLEFAENIGDRKQALNFLIGQIFAAREIMIQSLTGKWKMEAGKLVELLSRLDQARQDLENNINVRLTISDLLLHYPQAKT